MSFYNFYPIFLCHAASFDPPVLNNLKDCFFFAPHTIFN